MKIAYLVLLCTTVLNAGCYQDNKQSSTDNTASLFVTLPAMDSLIHINLKNNEVDKREKIGKLPHNIRMNKSRDKLYVTLVGSQAVAEINASSGQLIRTFLTAPVPMQDTVGNQIKAHEIQQAETYSNCFDCHNGLADSAKPVIVGTRPFGLALYKDQLIVTNTISATLSFIRLADGKIIRTLDINPYGEAHEPTELFIDEGKEYLYLTIRPTLPSFAPSVIRLYDIPSGAMLAETEVGSAVASITRDSSTGSIYVSNFNSNTIDQLDEKLLPTDQFVVGNGPFGMLLADDKLYVANYYNNDVSRIDRLTRQVTSKPLKFKEQVFANPTHLSLDAQRNSIFLVTGATKGNLLTLDSNTLQIQNSLPIDGLAFDIININQ